MSLFNKPKPYTNSTSGFKSNYTNKINGSIANQNNWSQSRKTGGCFDDSTKRTIIMIIIFVLIIVVVYFVASGCMNYGNNYKYRSGCGCSATPSFTSSFTPSCGMFAPPQIQPVYREYKPSQQIQQTEQETEDNETFIAPANRFLRPAKDYGLPPYSSLVGPIRKKYTDEISNQLKTLHTDDSLQANYTNKMFYQVNKATDTGINSNAERKRIGELNQSKLTTINKSVVGMATGNPRFNNNMIGSMMIDNRGEGFQTGEPPVIEGYSPTMSTNSRLAGSMMDIDGLTGTCFKKYDTSKFFENNTPFPPEMNIMNGKPEILKYAVNPTM